MILTCGFVVLSIIRKVYLDKLRVKIDQLIVKVTIPVKSRKKGLEPAFTPLCLLSCDIGDSGRD